MRVARHDSQSIVASGNGGGNALVFYFIADAVERCVAICSPMLPCDESAFLLSKACDKRGAGSVLQTEQG